MSQAVHIMLIHLTGQPTLIPRIHWHVHQQWMKNHLPTYLMIPIHMPISKPIMLASQHLMTHQISPFLLTKAGTESSSSSRAFILRAYKLHGRFFQGSPNEFMLPFT